MAPVYSVCFTQKQIMSRWFACVSHFCGVYVLSSATKTQSMIYAPEGSAKKTMMPLMGDIGVDHKIRKIVRHSRSNQQKADNMADILQAGR